jgi:hypothetical protein
MSLAGLHDERIAWRFVYHTLDSLLFAPVHIGSATGWLLRYAGLISYNCVLQSESCRSSRSLACLACRLYLGDQVT